jgi:REP element-mobilizing transposase RayT
MPRPPRIHVAGALYHTIARGNNGRKTFLDEKDYQVFLDGLGEMKRRTPFSIYAYCLMPNHFHLLVETGRVPLSVIMQRLLTRYVKLFNFRHHRIGHLFQGRYKAILCQKDAYLQELLRYIHLNPVRAKLAREASAWKWSSHGEYVGGVKSSLIDKEFPLSLFHTEMATSRRLYERFVSDGFAMGHNEQFYPLPSTPCLGEQAFIEDYLARVAKKTLAQGENRESIPLGKLTRGLKAGLALEMLRSSTQVRKVTAVRREFVVKAVKMGHRPSAVAAFLHCTPSAISKIIARSL